MSGWTKTNHRPGCYLTADGFHISYNPLTGALGSFFAGDGDGAETALCRNGSYFILNGDFRSQYEDLAPQGFEACKAFYDANKAEFGSSWSDEGDD